MATRYLRFEGLEHRHMLSVSATLSLGRATIDGMKADFDVTIDYAATENVTLSFFSESRSAASSRVRERGTSHRKPRSNDGTRPYNPAP